MDKIIVNPPKFNGMYVFREQTCIILSNANQLPYSLLCLATKENADAVDLQVSKKRLDNYDSVTAFVGFKTFWHDLNVLENFNGERDIVLLPFQFKKYIRKFYPWINKITESIDIRIKPNFDLLPIKKYDTYTIYSSLGCPFNCDFCFRARTTPILFKEPKQLVDEIEELLTFGRKPFKFYDEDFTINKKHAIEVCKEIIRRKLDIEWTCMARVTNLDEEVVKVMAKAGCFQAGIGIEAATQKSLDKHNKMVTLQNQKKAIGLLQKYKIRPQCFFILGLEEGEKEIERVIKYIKENDIYDYPIQDLNFFPGKKTEGIDFEKLMKKAIKKKTSLDLNLTNKIKIFNKKMRIYNTISTLKRGFDRLKRKLK